MWNDTKLYKKWWDEVFVPYIHLFTKDPVALILDGFSRHDEHCIDSLGQIGVFNLPLKNLSQRQFHRCVNSIGICL